MFLSRRLDRSLDLNQAIVGSLHVDLLLTHGSTDVAGNIEIVVFLLDLLHLHPPGVAGLYLTRLVGLDDLVDMLGLELVLPFSFLKVLGGVDEENIVRLFALLEHQDTHGNTGGVEEVGRQSDDGVDVAVFEQLGPDALFCTAAKEHAMGQDDRHHPFVFQEVEPMEQECEVSRGLGCQAVVFEAHIITDALAGFPSVAERWIRDDGVERWLLRRVQFAQDVPVIGQGVAVVYLEFRVLHPVQQHIHAGQVVRGDVFFLAVNLPDGAARVLHPLAYVEEQRARAASEVQHALQALFRSCFGFLTVECDDAREYAGNLLRSVELTRFFARPGGKLANKVFISIA